ncbi:MAG: ATP-binding cassette domain-containing protein, partial [Cyanobacteria bacterium]|nr:ATP-binding cassette domain-containing protein [Cyanobacteriota bacterium]
SPKGLSENARFGFQWFLAEILKYRQVIAEVLIGSFMIQLFALVTPLFTQVILDKVIVHNSVSTLNILVVGFVVISVFELLIQMTRNYIFGHTAGKIDAKLGAKLFRKLFSLPFVYFETRKVGDIISRVRELETVREFICNRAVSVVIDLFFSLVFVAMMLFYSVPLTLVVLAFVLVVGILYIASTPGFRDQLDEKFQMYAQSNSYLVESVTGVQTVKSLAIEGTLQRKWEDYLAKYLFSNFKLTHLSNVLGAVSQFLQKIMTIAMLYVGVTLVIQNQLTIGQLIAFQMFAGQFTTPVLRLVGLWQEFQQVLLAVDRLGDVLNHPIEVSSDKAITLPDIQGLVKFENISFKYSPESPMVLHQIGFEIQPGMCVGIVGRSGSGKSTVTKLIQRLYLPHEGAIFLDGIDVRHLNPTWLRSRIGVVLQESFLFSGTIRENISYPQPDAPIELIIEMAKLA